MTLLTIVQDAMEEIGEFEVPATVANNQNETAKQCLAILNAEGRRLARMKWSAMLKEYTFSTVDGTAAYDLPSDFKYIENASWWDRSQYRPLVGPASSTDWQQLKSSVVTSTVNKWFRIRNDQFEIHPTPSAAETIAYEYRSTGWCEDENGTAQTKFQADSDVGVVSEDILRLGLIWRFLKSKGLPYEAEAAEYADALKVEQSRDGGAKTITLAEPDMAKVNIPDGSWNL